MLVGNQVLLTRLDPPPFLRGILNWFLITEIKGKHLFGIIVYETSFMFVEGDCGNGFLHFVRIESMAVLGGFWFQYACLYNRLIS